MGQRTKDKSP